MTVDPLGPLVEALGVAAERNINVTTTRLGKVAAITSASSVAVLFDGETTASGKTYQRLTSYQPAIGDRVLLLRVGSTFVALGAIAPPDPPTIAEDMPTEVDPVL